MLKFDFWVENPYAIKINNQSTIWNKYLEYKAGQQLLSGISIIYQPSEYNLNIDFIGDSYFLKSIYWKIFQYTNSIDQAKQNIDLFINKISNLSGFI